MDKAELKGLKKFVRSPYHNRHKEVIQLLDFILTRKRLSQKDLDKKLAFAALFPSVAFDNMKIIHIMSYLLKVVEAYVAYLNWKEDNVAEQMNLVRSLRSRRLDKQFRQEFELFKKQQEKLPFRDARYHYFRYQLELEHYKHISEQRRDIRSNLQEISNGLNAFFIAEKLKQTCEILSHKTVEIKEYELGLLDEVLGYIKKEKKYLEIPAVALYYYGYKMLVGSEHQFFYLFKELLLENQELFPKEEIKDLHLIAINFCIKQLNLGNKDFNKNLFELYQSGLSTGIFIKEGVLSRFSFINIVTLGLRMNEFNWVQEFIIKYKKYLALEYRKPIFDYNQAKIYYEQKKYKSAMLLLLQTDVDDVLVNLDSKRMLLKMYYELNEYESLEALIDSFRVYLTRKKVIAYHKTNYLNILAILKKLIYLNPSNKKEMDKLKNRILTEDILTEREWLLDQVNN